jgi:hypothetical protein
MQLLKDRVDRKEITAGTIRNYLKSIKLFCQMADIPIAWEKITRGLPREKRYADERAPTVDEIKKLCEYPDRRIKLLVYTMVSFWYTSRSVGLFAMGRYIHLIEQDGKVVAAKMIVYAREDDAYITFITPSAYGEVAEWMKYRGESGEIITGNSWIVRDVWETRVKIIKGLVTIPKKLTAIGVKRLMERSIWAQALRQKLPE